MTDSKNTSDNTPEYLSPELSSEIRKRQQSRSNVLGLILAALAVLFFVITLYKLKMFG